MSTPSHDLRPTDDPGIEKPPDGGTSMTPAPQADPSVRQERAPHALISDPQFIQLQDHSFRLAHFVASLADPRFALRCARSLGSALADPGTDTATATLVVALLAKHWRGEQDLSSAAPATSPIQDSIRHGAAALAINVALSKAVRADNDATAVRRAAGITDPATLNLEEHRERVAQLLTNNAPPELATPELREQHFPRAICTLLAHPDLVHDRLGDAIRLFQIMSHTDPSVFAPPDGAVITRQFRHLRADYLAEKLAELPHGLRANERALPMNTYERSFSLRFVAARLRRSE